MEYTVPDFNIYKSFTDLQQFQFFDKYSKTKPSGQKETWLETIVRTTDFLRELSGDKLDFRLYDRMFQLMYMGEISPSMRLLQMSGPAARRDNSVIYNCAYLLIDSLEAFAEILYLSMSGCGVSFSVEKKNVNKLPIVSPHNDLYFRHIVEDTQQGWFDATLKLFRALWDGSELVLDYSQLRPANSPLKTKGGYSSGPQVLKDVHEFVRKLINNARGRKITTIEAHDLATKVAEAGISGGVRRAAQLSLFDYDDLAMHNAKPDGFWEDQNLKHRANANNSAVWPESVSLADIRQLTHNLFTTGTGEPGIFSRSAAIEHSPKRRRFLHPEYVGTNPCGEIILAPSPVDSQFPGGMFCNLSSVQANTNDTRESLKEKTFYATLIGDIQSLATNFPVLRPGWKVNTERDRLLGVNVISHATSPAARDASVLAELKEVVVRTDLDFAERFGVPQSAATTSVKPSGNSSVLYGCAPGINPVHGAYQLRNVKVKSGTPMSNFLIASGVPHISYPGRSDTHTMFSFPLRFINAITLADVGAVEQLNYWKKVQNFYTEHNCSNSIQYTADEVDDIREWLYHNQKLLGGLALFPKTDYTYPKMPIQVITEAEYEKFVRNFPKLDWSTFHLYENYESTPTSECDGGVCELNARRS